jgi:hypothetical protein
MLSAVSYGQQAIPTGTLPPEIANAIKSAPLTQTLIPVSGEERFSQQIIKADEITFSEGARMTLTNLDYPYVVVAAQRMKFSSPQAFSIIQRDPTRLTAGDGSPGAPGVRGADHPGETNRTGNPGYPGGPGGPGKAGAAKQIPDVYVVVGELLDPRGPIPPGILNLVLLFRGLDGGDGGTGGKGGSGGNAGNGKEGATSLFDCKEGGGPGGTGGTAGAGGKGGDAGNGGNGADLIFVTTRPGYDVLSFSRINNVGGRAGLPGRPGETGAPGAGGRGAGSNGFCKSTRDGSPGGFPSPIDLGSGNPGADGQKGSVTAVILPSVAPLFGR